MIDPNSIKVVNRDPRGSLHDDEYSLIFDELKKEGASIRSVAMKTGHSSKTVHKVRKENEAAFPKKTQVFRTPKLPRPKNVKRWLTVPKDVDEKIVKEARGRNLKWQEMAVEILGGRYDD